MEIITGIQYIYGDNTSDYLQYNNKISVREIGGKICKIEMGISECLSTVSTSESKTKILMIYVNNSHRRLTLI